MVDLLSRGGVQVNGRSVVQARLEEGDLLQVGPYVMRTRYKSTSRRRTMLAAPDVRAVVTAPPALPPALLNNDLLPPLFKEFQQMQQQMMGQFQQTLLMMAEMFSTLHKEQSALVREELEHLRRLTSELNCAPGGEGPATSGPHASRAACQRPDSREPAETRRPQGGVQGGSRDGAAR